MESGCAEQSCILSLVLIILGNSLCDGLVRDRNMDCSSLFYSNAVPFLFFLWFILMFFMYVSNSLPPYRDYWGYDCHVPLGISKIVLSRQKHVTDNGEEKTNCMDQMFDVFMFVLFGELIFFNTWHS